MWIYQQLFTVLFVAVISKVICTSAVTEFCAELEQTIRYTTRSTVSITSPDYPDSNYTTDQECVINIELVDDQTVGFSIEQTNLGDTGDRCAVDYGVFDSKDNFVPSRQVPVCTLDSNRPSITYGHHLINQKGVKIKLPSRSVRPGFHLNFTALPLHSLRSGDDVTEVSAESAPSGYIISQLSFNLKNPTFYSNNVYNRLRLTDIGGYSQIRLEFVYMNIGRVISCQSSGDIFQLYEESGSTSTTQLYSCGDTDNIPPTQIFNISSSSTSLRFQFQTDSVDRFRGFMIKYKLIPRIEASPKTPKTTKTTATIKATTAMVSEMTSITNPSKYTTSIPHAETNSVSSQTNYEHNVENTSTSLTTATLTEKTITPESQSLQSKMKEFFQEDINLISVAAGGAGLILVIIIIVLVCVLCGRSKKRKSNSSGDELSSINPKSANEFIEQELKPVSSNESCIQDSRYSDVELQPEADDNMKTVDTPYDVVLPKQAPVENADSSNRREPDGSEESANGEVTYAAINKPKVTMMDNDLYASQGSLSSSED